METEQTIAMETEESATDAFLAEWDDEAPVTVSEADQPKEETVAEPEPAADAAEKADAPDAQNIEQESAPETAAAETEKVDAPRTWTLRHMDEEKTVSEEEIVSLAQRGMDYERVRAKWDEAKPVMEIFRKFAKDAGMELPEYVNFVRQQAKQASGMSEAEAKRTVELEDREAAIAAAEAEKQNAKKLQDSADERRKADIAEFQQTFPDAAKKADEIPKEVWDDVRGGMRLVAAYSKYMVNKAKAEAAEAQHKADAAAQNAVNAVRSTGSMKSAGEASKSKDPFLSVFDD